MRVPRVLKKYEGVREELRPEQQRFFENYLREQKRKGGFSETFLLDRLRFPASDVSKLNKYVKLVAEETKKKKPDFQSLYASVFALEKTVSSLTQRVSKQKFELMPDQKAEQEIYSLNLPAFADKETLRTLHNVLRLPFAGSAADQKYLTKAKCSALGILRALVEAKESPKLRKALEFNAEKIEKELKAKGLW